MPQVQNTNSRHKKTDSKHLTRKINNTSRTLNYFTKDSRLNSGENLTIQKLKTQLRTEKKYLIKTQAGVGGSQHPPEHIG